MITREELHKKYPILDDLPFGVECGDGWFEILDELLEKVLEKCPNIVIHQIKEKFGGLRFYSSCYKEIKDFLREAEEKCLVTCEVTGKPGSLRCENGWYKVRCDELAEKGRV